MKKRISFYKALFMISGLLLTLMACEKNFTSIVSDIEGIKDFETDSKQFPVVAYNQKLNPVQTNNLSSNLLGIYSDPQYGKTKACVVSQIVPTSFDFNFGESPEVDSVMLTVPYYSKQIGTDPDGTNLYRLDSIYGNDPITLSIYQNKYFLRDYDPETGLEQNQKYYSNANQTIDFNAPNNRGELFYKNTNFVPSNTELDTGNGTIIGPSLRVELDNETNFWDELFFFDQENPEDFPEISNQNNFKNYFRGLYFQVEDNNNNGRMIMLNYTQASVIVYYSYVVGTTTDDNGDEIDLKDQSFIRMNFSGNRLNTLENDATTTTILEQATANSDPQNGDESLYLKGGEGAFALVDLFKGNITDDETGQTIPAFDYFKSKKDKWLLNDAKLTFYVNQNMVNGQEPDRVILYDMDNGVPIVDYFFDNTTNNTNPLNSKTKFSKKLERDASGNGVKYKLRLTEHLNNILLRDSTNVKLGLYVTTNINDIQKADILNTDERDTSTGSVLSPRGTVLYGNNNVPEDKSVQFEIYYTEPNN